MQTIEFKVSKRVGTGKQVTRKLRVDGIIPGVLYGTKEDPVNLSIPEALITELYRSQSGSNFIVNLGIDDDTSVMSIVRERQRHPVSGRTIHMDFLRISMDKPILLNVPVHLTGEAPGVKDFSGTLEHLLRMAEVTCLPKHIPEEILIDVSEMQINDSVHVSDINIEHVELTADQGRVIVAVSPPRISTEASEEEEGVEGEEGAEESTEESSEGDAE
ncbi:MAG: 50S ribosomal protein L25 [bacterium]|nr:50S ribosomal protein L25 [bacterium]